MSQAQATNSHTRETAYGLKFNLEVLLKLLVPSKTQLMQLPSESACEGRNQTEPVSCCEDFVVAAQRVFLR